MAAVPSEEYEVVLYCMQVQHDHTSCWFESNSWVILNLVPRACDPREGTWGSGIIHCRKPGILAKTKLRIPYQRPIRFLPEMDYPRASRSFPRIAGSGNEIGILLWHFAGGVNLKCIDAYAVLEWANDTKLHVFATKHKANTYSEQLIHSDDSVSI
jgi:hypothetical protein